MAKDWSFAKNVDRIARFYDILERRDIPDRDLRRALHKYAGRLKQRRLAQDA